MVDGIIYGLYCSCPRCPDRQILYVGQTTNFETRMKTHLAATATERTPKYKWIHAHGSLNIQSKVLEEGVHGNDLNDRERFWIREKNTFILDNPEGKNSTRGGDIGDMRGDELELLRKKRYLDNFNSKKLTWDDVREIRRRYRETWDDVEDIAEEFGIVSGTAYAVIMNRNWVDNTYTYVRRPKTGRNLGEQAGGSRKTWEEVRQIRDMFVGGTPVSEIAQEFGVSVGNVKDIGYGHTWSDPNYVPPTRSDVNKARKRFQYENRTPQEVADDIRRKYSEGLRIRDLQKEYGYSYDRVVKILDNELKPQEGYVRALRSNSPTPENVQRNMRDLAKQGKTVEEISSITGVSRPTVRRYIGDLA